MPLNLNYIIWKLSIVTLIISTTLLCFGFVEHCKAVCQSEESNCNVICFGFELTSILNSVFSGTFVSVRLQYHISKVSQSEPQMMSSSAAMDDLESALQSLEVKMEGESSSASEMLVRYNGCTCLLLSVGYCQDESEVFSPYSWQRKQTVICVKPSAIIASFKIWWLISDN